MATSLDGIEKLIQAMDPETQRMRLYRCSGYKGHDFSRGPMQEVYCAVEGVSKAWTLPQLVNYSHSVGKEVQIYTLSQKITPESVQQMKLFDDKTYRK